MKYLKGSKRVICALLALVFVFGMVPVDAIVHASGEAIFGETVLKGKRDFKWPVPGYYNISGCFFDGSGHYALDIITNTTDADIVASYDGVVCEIVRDGENDGGYGNAIMVQHTYTSYTGEAVTLYTHYSHMSSFAEGIAVGTNVVGGVTVLGKTGGSGFGSASTYPIHLDFQILTSSEWEYKTQYSIDPYANNLLELPSGLKKGGTTDCCQQYIDAAKALYATSLHTHSYEKTVTPPTCTADGYTTYTCSCGDKYTDDVITAPGHSYGTDFLCTACGEAEPLANGTCGDELTWILYKTGELVISGTGKMSSYTEGGAPWYGNREKITAVTIKDGVSSVGAFAFTGCSALTKVTISKDVTAIGGSAFRGCKVMAEITLPEGVATIGNAAFAECTALAQINIPSSVTGISSYAFYGCRGLTEIIIPDGVTAIDVSTFYNCSALKEITIPGSVTSIATSAFFGCSALNDVYYGGNAAEWIALGDVCSDADFIHYSCASGEGHWREVSADATCTEAGYSYETCDCGYKRNEVTTESALGHDYGADFVCTVCGDVEQLDSGTHGANVKWVMYKNGKLVISGTGDMYDNGAEHIPWGSYRADITSVVIEPGVTHIGMSAFYGCSALKEVTIPDSVTSIGVCAFMGCSAVMEITIPDSVTGIGGRMFSGCSSLTEITIPEGVTSVGDYAFAACSGLKKITIPDSVTSIGQAAFGGCSALKEIIIPDGVTTIGDTAFSGCSALTEITIPDSVISIGEYAFYSCDALTDVYYGGTAEEWTALGDYRANVERVHYSCESGEGHWREGSGSAICIVSCETCDCGYERNEVAAHSYGADFVCTVCGDVEQLDRGTHGANVKWVLYKNGKLVISGTGDMYDYGYEHIPWGSYRADITSVVIEPGVTHIGNCAFYGCEALTEITIPDSVTSIGESAFFNCSSLTEITIPEGVTRIGSFAFGGCSALTKVTIPDSITHIDMAAFIYCSALKEIIIPDGVTTICDDAFAYCSALTEIIIPEGVTSVGDYAFADCSALTEITIPDSVISIGEYAFRGCSALTEITIPDSVTSIGEGAFAYCSALTEITIPDSVTSIGEAAFFNCSALTEITIPDSVTSIATSAFYGCDSLADVYFGGTAEQWEALGDNRPDADFIHYSCASGENHWREVSADATCTEAGYSYETCDCGYKRNEVTTESALGHDMGEWDITDATCTVDGSKRRDCSRCDYYETEVITAPGHDYGEDFVCTVCGDVEQIANGICGDNLTWVLYKTGELVISGTGKMSSYTEGGAPWYGNREKITAVTIKDGVSSVGAFAFTGCSALTKVTISKDVTAIGGSAFRGCKVMAEITLPEGVATIGNAAFAECTALAQINIPSSVTGISSYAFYGCRGLTEITIPDGVAAIDVSTFYNCSALKEITIPGSVTSIAASAFFGCSALNDVYYGGNAAEWIALGDVCSDADFIHYSCASGEGHWRNVIEDATCTENGSSYEACDCGYKRNKVAGETALGHDMGEWDITDATCTVDGSKRKDCSRCDYFESEVITAPGHDYGEDFVCTVCGDVEQIANGICGINLTWILYKTGELVISGTGDMYNYELHELPPWYENKDSITRVTINNGATSIGIYAFYNCTALVEIALPESLTSIGAAAFRGCGALKEITVPEKVGIIGDAAFRDCTALKKVTILGSLSSITGECFYNCSGLEEIIIPEGVTEIGISAFYDCASLKKASLPDGVTTIDYCAFYGCKALEEINIPEGVTTIGDYAFYHCKSLKEIALPEGLTKIGHSAFTGCSALTEIIIPKDISIIDEYVFYGCSSLKEVIISEGVDAIGNNAFCGCKALKEITIPKSVTTIGAGAFSEGVELTDVYYGGTSAEWTALGDYCPNAKYIHYSCGSGENHWREVSVDATCTEAGYSYETCDCGYKKNEVAGETVLGHDMGEWDITDEPTCTVDGSKRRDCSRCDHFETEVITAPGHDYGDDFVCTVCGDVEQLDSGICGDNLIWVLYKNGKLVISGTGDMERYDSGAAPWYGYRKEITTVVIESGVTSISDSAFRNCNAMTEITIPDSITKIGYEVFYGCSALADVYITDPSAWCKITFSDRSSNPMDFAGALHVIDAQGNEVTEITLDESVTTIPYRAFYNCRGLKEITIPDSVIDIGDYAFGGCSTLTEITIPESVTGIGDGAFSGCSALTEITILGNITELGSYVFYNCDALTEITIPDTVTEIGDLAFANSDALAEITIPDSVTSIGDWAFYSCDALTEITIPNSVTSIGDKAFSDCNSLSDVYYGGTSDEWTALGDNRPDADYIHYSCASGEDHWREVINGAICTEAGSSYETCDCGYKRNEVTTESGLGHDMGDWSITDEPTCTVDGSQRRDCSRCDHFETEVIPAGHDMGEWYTVTEATPETDGEERSDCSRCDHYETRTTQFVDNMLKLEGNDFANKTTVYINGLPYPVVVKGDERYVELPTEEDCSIVTYDFHVGDPNDVHTQYPVSMKVYIVSDGKITYVKELDNLLQYSGSSIRITGKKGIRMITSLYQNTKSALKGKGLAGYKLVEYGTVLAFAHEVAGDGDLVLGKSYSRSNYAYKRGVSDPVFANKGNLTQYTNVLVGFNLDQCKEDIAMRPYIILENAKGEQFTIYGGTIYRSIGYVAYQNRNAVAPRTAAYSFVWDIIHHVYGNKYDKDYKG